MTAEAPAPTPGPASAPNAAAPAAPAAPASPAPDAAQPSVASLLYEDGPAAPPAPAAPAAPRAAGQGEEEQPAPGAAEGDKPAGGNQPEAETIGLVSELLEHYQLDPEYFQSLKIDVKVDRETLQVPVSELVKNYQIGEAANRRLEDAKSTVKAVTQDLAAKSETLHSQLSAAAALVKEAEAELAREYNAVDWKTLKEKDPAKYAADQLDFEKRLDHIKELREKGSKAWQEVANQRQSEAMANLKDTLIRENEALLAVIPEWKDEKVRLAEKKQLAEYLTGPLVGLTQDQINVVTDHRFIVMARKAMQQDALQDKKAALKQRVTKIPKVLKPNGSNPPPPAPKNSSAAEVLYGS